MIYGVFTLNKHKSCISRLKDSMQMKGQLRYRKEYMDKKRNEVFVSISCYGGSVLKAELWVDYTKRLVG